MSKKIHFDQIEVFKSENKGLIKKIHPFQHAYRLNGVVDIYKHGFCVYDRVNNIYHKLQKIADVFSLAKKILSENKTRDTFDSRKNGQITYKTFQKRKENSDWRPENNHWDLNKDKISDDHLYFASDGLGRLKIGRSKNPKQRIKHINTSNASNVELVMIARNKGCIEKNMHSCFSGLKIKGEWFSYSSRFDDFMKYVRKNNNGCSISFFKPTKNKVK